MSDKKIFDIHERIYNWVIKVIKFTQRLPKTQQNLILVKQLIASVTSVGANDQEADAVNSKKDFVAKYSIARKECNESVFWIKVCRDTNENQDTKEVEELLREGKEIFLIISTIMKNAQKGVI